MGDNVLETRDLRIVRGGNEILLGIDASIPGGKITGLLGPSGCGKTTLMRAIIGTQRITSGTISVLGMPAGSAELRTKVAYASQEASVYDDLTIVENVRYFATAVRAPKDDVERVINAVDLDRYRNQLTGKLSGGQRSRVSLAVAMLGTPQLLVLDEPTVGLDPVLREDLWELFHRLAETGMTLLVSSHVMDEAERCHALLLMRAGRILTQDTPQGLKARTGTDTLDKAFLALVTEEEAA